MDDPGLSSCLRLDGVIQTIWLQEEGSRVSGPIEILNAKMRARKVVEMLAFCGAGG